MYVWFSAHNRHQGKSSQTQAAEKPAHRAKLYTKRIWLQVEEVQKGANGYTDVNTLYREALWKNDLNITFS